MRTAVALLNLVIFLFGFFVLIGDGPPAPGEDMRYVIWSFTTHLFSAGMILGSADSGRWPGLVTRAKALVKGQSTRSSASLVTGLILLAAACNAVLIGLVCWHLASQRDHPAETGVVALACFMFLTPLLSLGVLLRSAPR